jgi:hypothetical protein
MRRKVIASYSYHSGLIEIVVASYNYRSNLKGIVNGSNSFCSKVTKSLLLLIIMLLTGYALITTPGFSPSGVNLSGHTRLGARDMGKGDTSAR